MHPLNVSVRSAPARQLGRAPAPKAQPRVNSFCAARLSRRANAAPSPLKAPRASAAATLSVPLAPPVPVAVPAPTAPPAPAAPPAPTAPPAPAAGALDILREQVFHVLEDLHQRSADRDSWTPQLDRYFFAQKHQQVKRVRALFEAAFAYAASHADHPHLRALVDSDGFADWISATHSMEQTLQLMSPPPAAVAPGALHRLRNAMAQLQLLRSAWPQALS